MNFLNWISENPAAVSSIISAVIAASIAFVVFALTQYFSYRRERIQFLSPKLEELYLLLNETSADNVKFFKLVSRCLIRDQSALEELNSLDEIDLYGLGRSKKIIMYVQLYFSNLKEIHVLLFRAQQAFNELIYRLHTDSPPEIEEVVQAIGENAHFLRLMEDEIIRNRDKLLGDYLLWKRYKRTSQEELESRLPLPSGTFENLFVVSEVMGSPDPTT